MKNLKNFFFKKKVIITGHTGFKGAWLTFWLNRLGANVMGLSDKIPTKPSFFQACKIEKSIDHKIVDIRNYKELENKITSFKPDLIFHLAAQALVKKSYDEPLITWQSNTMGTINLLEILRKYKKKCSAVIITSDKAYKNLEIKRGYNENDTLAGIDPYSASKSCADIAIQSYISCYFKNNNKVRVAIARAGNVIGGGDWSQNRFIVDCIKSWIVNKPVSIRNPKATRPWQHVLEALNGYMNLAFKLHSQKKYNGQIFNFGPENKSNFKVLDILKKTKNHWNNIRWKVKVNKNLSETTLLKLNSNKAKKLLKWKNVLSIDQTLKMIVDWYKTFYFYNNKKNNKIVKLTINQIIFYENETKK
jgi:CDP-glucose 4,6-dehydratase